MPRIGKRHRAAILGTLRLEVIADSASVGSVAARLRTGRRGRTGGFGGRDTSDSDVTPLLQPLLKITEVHQIQSFQRSVGTGGDAGRPTPAALAKIALGRLEDR